MSYTIMLFRLAATRVSRGRLASIADFHSADLSPLSCSPIVDGELCPRGDPFMASTSSGDVSQAVLLGLEECRRDCRRCDTATESWPELSSLANRSVTCSAKAKSAGRLPIEGGRGLTPVFLKLSLSSPELSRTRWKLEERRDPSLPTASMSSFVGRRILSRKLGSA